jgi:hypothetical protein
MSLPTKIDEVKSFIHYQSSGIAGLEPTDIQVLFQAIHDHTLSWDSIESKTLQQAIDLQIYATNIVTAGNDIVDLIKEMSLIERAKKLGTLTDKELKGITYGNDDKEVAQALGTLLERMKADIAKEQIATAKVATAIGNFRIYISGGALNIANEAGEIKESGIIVTGLDAQVRTKKELMNTNNLSATIASDEQTIKEKKQSIDQLQKDYDRYMVYVFAGSIALVTFAVTASVFGPKAIAAREDKEKLIAEVTALEAKVTSAQALQKALEALANQFRDIGTRLQDAEVAIWHLDNMWKTLYANIHHSHDHFKTINDAMTLLIFLADFKKVIDPWKEVGPIAKDLQVIIDQVLIEWKQENQNNA